MDKSKEKLSYLSRVPILESLEDSAKAQLLRYLRLEKAKRGYHIIRSSQRGNELLFLCEGTADVMLSNTDGREVIVSRLGPGEIFGEISLLTGADRTADVVAVSDCKLLLLSGDDFRNHLMTNSAFLMALLIELAQRVSAASTKIGDLALLDVSCRLQRALKSMATQDASRPGYFVLNKRPTHQELAAMVGSSREVVTRALKRLQDDELLEIDGKKIILSPN